MTGAGTLVVSNVTNHAAATYTPPTTMPANASVTITVDLSSYPATSVSYPLTLINPLAPTVTSTSPTQLLSGGTQTVTVTGSSFTPTTTVTLGGTALTTTYTSYNQLSVQVPVAVNATGTLALQVQNPGVSGVATFNETVAPNSIAVTSNLAGTNPTTLLGSTVNLSDTVAGSTQTAVNWSVTGGGSISSSGVYTAPSTMPSSAQVTIVAALASNNAITGSYSFTLNSPVPAITSASPAQAIAGATIPITLTGHNFIQGMVVTVNGAAVPTTYTSSTSVSAQVTAAAGSTANLSLLPQNPSPVSGASAAFSLPTDSIQVTGANSDGSANNGQVSLAGTLTLETSLINAANGSLTWQLQGAGTLAPGGSTNGWATYTAPVTMPSNPNVTITASLSSNPLITASYTFTLVVPPPVITTITPAPLETGGTTEIYVHGSGFVAGTTITVNGAAVTTTFQSSVYLQAWAPVGNAATGSVSIVTQNPAPGGSSAPYSLPVAVNSIAVAPVNGPSVSLGGSLTVGATVSGSLLTAVNWSVSGGGTISSGGSYTAPLTMPTGSVVITATLASNNAITGSYTVTLVNPVPAVYSTSVQAVAGATVPITISGNLFVPSTVILVSGVAVPTTFVSPTSVTAQISAPASQTSNLSIQAQNPTPGGGTSAAYQLSTASLQITATDPDGTNTGTVRLGVPVNFTTVSNDTAHTGRAWTLQGAGTLSSGGTNVANATYTPPATMPANPTVTVTVDLSSLPALTTSYPMTLIYPVPTVSSATPTQLLTGGPQTVTLVGTGFVPGTTVAFNGTNLPITYLDYNDATVQVPVAGNATGTLSLQVQNPTPGGGAGTTFTESVASTSMTLTANDGDGTNTGTAELGVSVTMAANVIGAANPAVNWTVTGAGSISSAGVYTAPAAMPANQAVTIQASLASNSAITASYALTIINPDPAITAANPATVPAGETSMVTLTGTGFVPSTVIEVNGTVVPTTYVSATSIKAQITVGSNVTGNLQVQAYTATFTGGLSPFINVAVATGIGGTAAARLLDQTTFGPTTSLIQHVQQEGVNAWLTEQFNAPPTLLPIVPATLPSYCSTAELCVQSYWWQNVLTANDQLRQRVAFALSELFVVSGNNVIGQGIDYYQNVLLNDAFTNWYTIMNDVTLSPAMGVYLNMLDSAAATGTLIANENFARENMQLFNLGLNLINQDGSLHLDANSNPIPTYTQAQVQAFARVDTGWTFANANGSTPSYLTNVPNYYHPLVALEQYHDENPKTLLDGTTLPAGQTAEQDMAAAQTNIFQHPNLPPFVCKQLITHLVKSNPSPGYISRVAQVFINDGNNVRGDMQAVLTAILTDPEARAGDTAAQASDGHLREPMLWITDVMRGLGFVNVNANNYWENVSSLSKVLGEQPYQSPAVFNFYPPSYVIPGTTLPAPEFALENTGSITDTLTAANTLVFNDLGSFNVDLSATSPLGQILTSQGPAALVNALSQLFLYGTMDSSTAAAITNEITTAPDTNPAQQVRMAVYLTITSSEYKILH